MELQLQHYPLSVGTAQPRVFLQPIAAPSILGLFGYAGATFIIAAHMARWIGSARSDLMLLPFAALFGGFAQFIAGMWAFKARDGLATAVHGTWGTFWMAYAILDLMMFRAWIPVRGAYFPELGFWFIVVAAICWAATLAAIADNKAMVTLLTLMSAGSTVAAIALLTGTEGLLTAGGYLLLFSSFTAWYTASALMVNEAHGREVWHLGRSAHMRQMPSIATGAGEPGVIRGQA